jgi:hypothetical protein
MGTEAPREGTLRSQTTRRRAEWRVIWIEGTGTGGAHAKEPRSRWHDRRVSERVEWPRTDAEHQLTRSTPANEPRCRRAKIPKTGRQLPDTAPVFPRVHEHIEESEASLTRRPERASVVAIREHAAVALEPTIDGTRDAHAEALETTG